MDKTGILTITAKSSMNVFALAGKPAVVRLSIDGCEQIELPWGEPQQFVLAHGEHELVVDPGPGSTPVDTYCWIDDAGVTIDFILAGPSSLLGDRFSYRD